MVADNDFARITYTEAVAIVQKVPGPKPNPNPNPILKPNPEPNPKPKPKPNPDPDPTPNQVPGPKPGVAWEFPPKWGEELQTEHEKYLAESVYKKPVIVYNYPKGCKAFYMRLNDDNEVTTTATRTKPNADPKPDPDSKTNLSPDPDPDPDPKPGPNPNQTVGAMDVLFPRVGEMVGGSQREERLDVLLERMGELGLKEEDYSAYLDTRRFGSQPHSGFGVGFERLVLYATAMGNIRDVIPFPRSVGQMLH